MDVNIEKDFILEQSDLNFNRLYNKYYKEIYYAINKILKKVTIVEEVTNDVFLKIKSRIKSYNPEYSFKTWIYTIAINEAKTIYNKEKKQIICDFSNLESNGEELVGQDIEIKKAYYKNSDNVDDYDHTIDTKYKKVLEIIETLTPKHREIMYDREVNGLTYEQLATKYDININTLRSRIKDGRVKILKALKP